MLFNQCIKAGTILKTHGKDGELMIEADIKLPDNFIKEESIFIEIDGLLVPFFMEHIFLKSAYTAVVKFEDINTIEEAEELTNLNWHIDKEKWANLTGEDFSDYEALTGYILINQNDQQIGEIQDVISIPSNTLLEVTYQGKTIEVPVNEETLFYIDEENNIVKNTIPEGLLDL